MEERTMIKAAVLYYQHEMTHEEIGRVIGASRVSVTRALQEARNRGLVEFVIHDPVAPFEQLEQDVASAFGLRSCRVSPSFSDFQRTIHSLGRTGAEALAGFLPEEGTVAVAMSGALSAVVSELRAVDRNALGIASVTGSVSRSTPETSSTLAINLAQKLGATPFLIPGPLRSAPAVAAALREDPTVAHALQAAANATHLLVGVGSMHPGGGRLRDRLEEIDRERLLAAGAVGDIASRFFDALGDPVHTTLDDELLSLTLDQLTQIPHTFAVAAGLAKLEPLRVLLGRGRITDLVIDEDLARALVLTHS